MAMSDETIRMYKGKPALARFQTLIVKSVIIAEIIPVKKGMALSVSGKLKALTIVGSAARASARILKMIATFPDAVIYQRIRPITDKPPQTRSKRVNFHRAFLLTKEAMKIVRGRKPTINVIKDGMPTPCCSSATKAIRGASDHNKKETRFGFTLPLMVAIR